ncbi:MurR/RpiR family transcriptional regulator [Sporolactobacillus terrae]|uniref:RpiR family transcriptional regulator n=1 Tax=Sporolactobacillus terrae TaxID=269673 RepID=A0A410D7G6_9BACL|nr:MurR/RpiR family transcriptional regulator [Sporolactobacillus terrae]QAA22059.1 MurR/RpiR family transcriptional regulator [Sporolactobacillus terrae]QAA25032.1 MurR/RpiR family transcriptional regulator [Sporolactobacillus terrae]UAK16855.1 MurR/RpiR family transcriptional regulator [Sporolactobacillus terrae]BBN98350.1 RpiR family transcriptional regulator [Sporolactobacillus terrae]
MTESQCIVRIQSAYPHLSEKERRIADYILNHPKETIHSSINQVSARIKVADATVFRFCRRLDFKGFQEMKIVLASDIARSQRFDEAIKNESSDEMMKLAEQVFQDNIRTLENTYQILNRTDFKQAVRILTHSNRIALFGSSGSALIAQEAHRKFVRAGVMTYAPNDGEFQMLSATQLSNLDAAVFISYSATDKHLVQVAKMVKQKKCPAIGITGFMKSALGELMDVSLHTVAVPTDFRSESYVARAAQMTLIDALFVSMMNQRKEAQLSDDTQNSILLQG